MDNIKDAAHGIKIAESGGNYHHQQAVRVGGTKQRKVGAYGIIESRMAELTEAMGLDGADWRDRAVQDRIAEEFLSRAYGELEDMNLSVVAFRYGMPLARALKQQGAKKAGDIEAAGYNQAGQYLRNVQRNKPVGDMPVEGSLQPPEIAIPGEQTQDGRSGTPNRRRAENIVRKNLVTMRNAQRRTVRNSNQTEEVPPVEEPV